MAVAETDFLLGYLLPVLVILLMAGMGATITEQQIIKAVKSPRAVLCGMVSQFVLMPLIAYALYKIFELDDQAAVGLFIVACTPGGTTSNLFAFWSDGDVALSIIMTMCSSIVAIGAMPVVLGLQTSSLLDSINAKSGAVCAQEMAKNKLYTRSDGSIINQYCWDSAIGTVKEDECQSSFQSCETAIENETSAKLTECLQNNYCKAEVAIDQGRMVLTLVVLIVLPVAVGIMARRSRTRQYLANAIQSIGTNSGTIVVFVAIVWGAIKYPYIWRAKWNIWLTSFFIGSCGFFFGYNLAWACQLTIKQRRTVSLETGIQNGPLAIAVAQLMFHYCPATTFGTEQCLQSQVLIFPFIYSVFIVLQSVGVTVGLYSRFRTTPLPILPENQSLLAEPSKAGASARRHHEHTDHLIDALVHKEPRSKAFQKAMETGVRSPCTQKGEHDVVRTLYEALAWSALQWPNNPCLGTRELLPSRTGSGKMIPIGRYRWLTYAQVFAKARYIGSGLLEAAHMTPNKDPNMNMQAGLNTSRLGLYSANRAEWSMCAAACDAFSLVSVPLYDTLGPDAVKFILRQTKITVVAVSKAKLDSILAVLKDCEDIHTIVQFENVTSDQQKLVNEAAGRQVQVFGLEYLMAVGQKASIPPVPPTPEHCALICYTSGTTGNPKGAMLSHRNIIADVAGVVSSITKERAGVIDGLNTDDCHLSYLPLAHIMERTMQASLICHGASIGFYGGDVSRLTDDLIELKPTIFVSVPRLLNKLVDKITAAVQAQQTWSCWGAPNPALFSAGDTCGRLCSQCKWPPPNLKRVMFEAGYKRKKDQLALNVYEHGFWDSSVFQALSMRIGGRVRLIITGSAPISGEVLDFLRICFKCPVLEGYGQSECGAACSITNPDDLSIGHVGPPIPCNEIRLDAVPDMGYSPHDTAVEDLEAGTLDFSQGKGASGARSYPRGEICIRGPNVFMGYFDMPGKTSETIDSDGWLHTGDVGMWLPGGKLKIIDRKKNIFKLSQGEYVAPEKIENVYLRCPLVAQIFVYGDSLQHQLVAVVVPDFDVAFSERGLKKQAGLNPLSNKKELCADSTFRADVLRGMDQAAKEGGLKGFEKARAIYLEPVEFSVENELLTATSKSKRPQMERRYRGQIDALYDSLKAGKPVSAQPQKQQASVAHGDVAKSLVSTAKSAEV